MGYLVCENCKGYYKLQPGESPDDFSDECKCGGNLKYYDQFDPDNVFIDQVKDENFSWRNLFSCRNLKNELRIWGVLISIIAISLLLFGLYTLFFIQGHTFISVLSALIGISLLFLGVTSFFVVDNKIFWAYAAAATALLLQNWILNTTTGSPTWHSIAFIALIAYYITRASIKARD